MKSRAKNKAEFVSAGSKTVVMGAAILLAVVTMLLVVDMVTSGSPQLLK